VNQKDKRNHPSLISDNRGFSLVELLISIIILILIMIPLMNNFFRAASINKEAAKLQDYSNIASNLIEDLKAMSISDVKKEPGWVQIYRRSDGSFGSELSDQAADDTNEYYGTTTEAYHGIVYDVLITIDKDKEYNSIYNSEDDPLDHDGIVMNNFEMPDIAAINENINGMLDSQNSVDQLALDYFKNAALNYVEEQFKLKSIAYQNYLQNVNDWYALCEEAEKNGEEKPPHPTEPSRSDLSIYGGDTEQIALYCNPDYITEAYIKDKTIKTAEITISNNPTDIEKSIIDYQISYDCSWGSYMGMTLEISNHYNQEIGTTTYGSKIDNIYYYYEKSLYESMHPDHINIVNNSENEVNLFIVEQASGILDGIPVGIPDSEITVKRSGTKMTNLYTNNVNMTLTADDVPKIDINSDKIVTSSKKDRIYSIRLQIFKHAEGADQYHTEELYSLDSNQEN